MSNLLGRTLRHRDDPLLSFTHPFSYFTNYFYEYIHISNDCVCYVEGWRGVTRKGGTCGGIYRGGIDGGGIDGGGIFAPPEPDDFQYLHALEFHLQYEYLHHGLSVVNVQ